MLEFEIRIFNADGKPTIRSMSRHMNSDTAVSFARRLAGNKHFEVWDGDRCLYTTMALHPKDFGPPRRPAA